MAMPDLTTAAAARGQVLGRLGPMTRGEVYFTGMVNRYNLQSQLDRFPGCGRRAHCRARLTRPPWRRQAEVNVVVSELSAATQLCIGTAHAWQASDHCCVALVRRLKPGTRWS